MQQFDHIKIFGVNMLNYIKIHNAKCEECQTRTLAYDPHHDIIYCLKCGLVHKDNTIMIDWDKLMEKRAKELEEIKEIKRKLVLQQRDERIIMNKEGNLIFNQYWFTFW